MPTVGSVLVDDAQAARPSFLRAAPLCVTSPPAPPLDELGAVDVVDEDAEEAEEGIDEEEFDLCALFRGTQVRASALMLFRPCCDHPFRWVRGIATAVMGAGERLTSVTASSDQELMMTLPQVPCRQGHEPSCIALLREKCSCACPVSRERQG